jgi:poly(3-hydroxybutyrate) depolymerase
MSVSGGAPARPVAILHIQSADDEPMPGETGERSTDASLSAARRAIAFWREVNRLNGETPADLFGGGDCTIYSGAGGEPEIRFCVVAGFGHRWPGGPAGGEQPSLSRDRVNEAILHFFAEHSLPEAQSRRIRLGAATATPS